jgi:hypothetical protein
MSKRLVTNLKRRASAWAGQLTSLARQFAPSHVRSAISSHVEEKDGGFFRIRITADRKIAPDARAQEFGSGLHARRGVKKKYTIRPKNQRVLAFNWEIANANPERFVFAPDGRVLLPKVEHPGIEAANSGKGYIAPAMREIRKRAKRELSQEIREAIVGDLRESFGRKAR